jgi:aldehyde:ferredoxin oxidoreductase
MATPVYTKAEKAKRARLLFKGAKGAYGDTSAIDKQIDRIDAAARERGERVAAAHQRALEAAKDEVARARVMERTAPRHERQAARETRRAAEKRLRLVERAAR